jgi:Flp pilus assembly pilin Flp
VRAGLRRWGAAFARGEAGAATVEYVVLAAAAVGLGLATVGAVRNGVGTLGGDTGTSLTGGAVLAVALPPGGGTGGTGGGTIEIGGGGTRDTEDYPVGTLADYSLRHYDQNTYDSLQRWVSTDFRDNDLTREYSYQVGYLTENMAYDQLSRETLDWIYVLAYEMTRRGLGYPNNTMTFDQVVALYDSGVRAPVTPPARR